MNIGLALGSRSGISRERRIELAADADEAGFEAVFIGESVSSNAFMDLTAVALETVRVTLGVSIANVFTRTPSLIAMSAGYLDRISNGRALLGLGASTPQLIEGVHGVEYESPLPRLEEYVEIVRKASSGERFKHRGTFYSPSGGRLRVTPVDDLPVGIAALGPKAVRLTGRVADAWIPHLVPRSFLPELAGNLTAGAGAANRSSGDVTVYGYVPTCVHEDERTAVEAVRHHVASYVGPAASYRNVIGRAGYEREVEEISDSWGTGDRERAVDSVTDEMVADLGIATTPDAVRGAIEHWESVDSIDTLVLNSPRNATLDTIERTIDTVAPLLDGES